MKRFSNLIVLLLLSKVMSAQNHFDIMVPGGNIGGILEATCQNNISIILSMIYKSLR